MLGFGLWWLGRAEAAARAAGEGFGDGADVPVEEVAERELVRERASVAREFDPPRRRADSAAAIRLARAALLPWPWWSASTC